MAFVVPYAEVSSLSGCRLEIPVSFVPTSSRNFGNQKVLKKNRIDRVRLRSKVKDLEVGISEFGHDLGMYRQFSAPVKPSTSSTQRQSKEDEEKQNYYVNTGYAIRTLREEFPELFYRELSFDIYRDDIVFKDPVNSFIGIQNYKSIFWALRFHGRIFFRALWLDIVSVWQPAESTIMVRWTVHGFPRVPWETRARFDGTSEYKLDKNGKIYEHRVHNIALNAPPKYQILAVDELILSIGCPSSPKPTYFKISSPSILNVPSFVKSPWVRDYITSVFDLARGPEAGSSRRT